MTIRKNQNRQLIVNKKHLDDKSAKTKFIQKKNSEEKKSPSGNIFILTLKWIIKFWLKFLWRVFWRSLLITSLIIAVTITYFTLTLPSAALLLDGRARGSVTLLDSDGNVFAWRGEQFGVVIDSENVSPYLKNAILVTEDKRFYKHLGLSPRGIAGAIKINLSEGRGPLSGHGGSTITQQVAKLLCIGTKFSTKKWPSEQAYEAYCRERTIWRKIKEAVYSLALEIKFTKEEIMTIYLNRVFLGAGARGFEAAARRYFDKSAANVSPAEAAMLAGLIVAPTRYAPTNNLGRSQDRARLIIGLMEKQKLLTEEEAEHARKYPAKLSSAAAARSGGYFADWIMSSGPSYFTNNTAEDVIIKTTFNQSIQNSVEKGLAKVFAENVRAGSKAQAAVIIMTSDGAVKAMVGGLQTKVSGVFNRSTQALRQTGSAFKPFIYATALDFGFSPYDLISDSPLKIQIPGSGSWSPKNYTGEFYGNVTLIEAFQNSLNIPAVRLTEKIGRQTVREVASGFGLTTDLAKGPAIALGASEATLIEMVGAYAGILNGGSEVRPYGLLELTLSGESKPLMGFAGGLGERIIKREAAGQLIYMMEKAVSQGTGRRALIPGWEIAGKTGTTQAARDAWFIGFTADYVTGIWIGYDDNTPLQGVTGGGLPAEIWKEVMLRVYKEDLPGPLPLLNPKPPTNNSALDLTEPLSNKSDPIILLLRSLFGLD